MTIVVEDSFTDANFTELSQHAPDIGGAWTNLSGENRIWVGRLYHSADGSTARYQNAATPASRNQLARAVIRSHTFAGNIGVELRRQANGDHYLFWYGRTAEAWQISRVIVGVGSTVLGSFAQTLSTSTDYVLGAEVIGVGGAQTLRLLVDDVERISVQDAAISDPGAFALWSFNGSGSSSGGLHLDFVRFESLPAGKRKIVQQHMSQGGLSL